MLLRQRGGSLVMTSQRRYLYLARDVRKMAVDLYSMQRPDHLPITRGSCHCLEQWYLMKWGCHEIETDTERAVGELTLRNTRLLIGRITTPPSHCLSQASGSSYNDGEYSIKIFWPHEPCRPDPAPTPQAPAQKTKRKGKKNPLLNSMHSICRKKRQIPKNQSSR